jgi:hypothetical protein
MRMLMHVKIPNEPFNSAVRKGTVGDTIQRILGEIKPEAVYFTEYGGRRGCVMIVDVADASKVPGLAEPFFLSFNAEVRFHIVMTPEDLGRSGVDTVGKNWPAVG